MTKSDIILSVDDGRILEDFSSTREAGRQGFTFGDLVDMNITGVRPNLGIDSPERPWVMVDMTAKEFRVAVGTESRLPFTGQFTVLTSADIEHNATAAAVESALNAEATISAEGGVTVTALDAGGWRVTYNTDGAKTAISATGNTLLPSSDIFIDQVRLGASGVTQVWMIRLETAASAYAEFSDDIPAPTVSIVTVREGDTGNSISEVQSVTMEGQGVSGTYALTIDGAGSGEIAIDADAVAIAEAIASLPIIGGNVDLVTVLGDARAFTVTFDYSLGDLSGMVVDYSNLGGFNGKQGTLDLNTIEIAELLNGSASKQGLFEVVLYNTNTSTGQTVHQSTVIVTQDIISSTPPSVTPIPLYADASHTHPIAEVIGLQTELDDLQGQITVNTIENVTRYQGLVSINAPIRAANPINDTNLRVAESVGERLTIVMNEDLSSIIVEKTIMTLKNVNGVENYISLLVETIGVITSDDEILAGSLIGDHYLIAYNGGSEYNLTGGLTAFDRLTLTPSFFTQSNSTSSGIYDNFFAEVLATWQLGDQARVIKFDCLTGVRNFSGTHRKLNVISSMPNSSVAIAGVLYDNRNLPVVNHIFGCIDEDGQMNKPSLNFQVYQSLTPGAGAPIVNIT